MVDKYELRNPLSDKYSSDKLKKASVLAIKPKIIPSSRKGFCIYHRVAPKSCSNSISSFFKAILKAVVVIKTTIVVIIKKVKTAIEVCRRTVVNDTSRSTIFF